MAWIAVHEQVDGAKLRDFRKKAGCSKCEATGILVTLWLWGINNAARNGELINADRADLCELFAFNLSDSISPKKVVSALISTKWIDDIDGKLFIHDWAKWQELWFKAVDRREKDNARKKPGAQNPPEKPPEKPAENSSENLPDFEKPPKNPGEIQPEIQQENALDESPEAAEMLDNSQDSAGKSTENPRKIHGDSSATVTVTVTKPINTDNLVIPDTPPTPPQGGGGTPKSRRRRNPSTLSKEQEVLFNRFWEAYPRKVAIGEAEKAWTKIFPNEALVEHIIAAVEKAVKFDHRFRETQYTPHPSTWLNGKEWLNKYDERKILRPEARNSRALGHNQRKYSDEEMGKIGINLLDKPGNKESEE